MDTGGYDSPWLDIDFSLTPGLIIGVCVWWDHNGAYLQIQPFAAHAILFSYPSGLIRAVIDSLIAFNYKVNDFSPSHKSGYLFW